MVTVPKPDVFPSEESDNWVPYTDDGGILDAAQPSRIRAISLQITNLCEISNDILLSFYNPNPPSSKSLPKSSPRSSEFKKLGDLFSRLEAWRKNLPAELEARGGSLPSALLMHMFHQTLYIHLFRPFLKFSNSATPLTHLDPRKACLHAATNISKYLRFYRHRYRLKQICNVAAYFVHTACTIHLLNLPQRTAVRDIGQALNALEEMGECWLVAKRSLVIIDVLVRRWQLDIPEEAAVILARVRPEARRWGLNEKSESGSPYSDGVSTDSPARSEILVPRSPVEGWPQGYANTTQHQQQTLFAPVWGGAQGGVGAGGSEQWLLRDQQELGVGLQGLGELGWEGGEVGEWSGGWEWGGGG
jgi:hypothetical protein